MKYIKFIYLLFITLISIERTFLTSSVDFDQTNVDKVKRSIFTRKSTTPDFISLVKQYGYPAEEYPLQTQDLYNLLIHRIPGSPLHPKGPRKPVIYIHHGVFGLSDMFVLGGPNKDLADAGYDVWLGNTRGNTYCRSHALLLPDRDEEFWDFSFHEVAVYDMTATIDYILQQTNHTSLIYVGHSMSTTMILILLSVRPEYNQKIHLVLNMASIANWKRPTPFIQFFKRNGATIKTIFQIFGIYELFPHRSPRIFSNRTYCEEDPFQGICIILMNLMNGINSDMDSKILLEAFAHVPAGTSRKTGIHYYQNLATGKLQMFDYGVIRNMATYGTVQPPLYNLTNIITDVYMFYGKGDTIADQEDTLDLLKHLKNSRAEVVPIDNFSHLDFLWGKNLKTLLNDRVLQVISNYTKF